MEPRAWGIEKQLRTAKRGTRLRDRAEPSERQETGSPPEGWESEGTFPIANLKKQAEGRRHKSEMRGQKSGKELISDLRLLASVIDDFNGFDDLPFIN